MQDKFSFKRGYRGRTIFNILNTLFFILLALVILIPIWKVIVDSVDASGTYGMNLWPRAFTMDAYKVIFTDATLYRPFVISIIVTIAGTVIGLALCTVGAYVLIQFDMPGRMLFSYLLLFTMIFNAGLMPTYLVVRQLGLLDTLWAVILTNCLNVYNLILMRNFFEGIPDSLYESAELDGCTPMGIFVRIVLPLSKPALASIGLFFAVTFWSQYTSFVYYITDPKLNNFQAKLRSLIIDDQTLVSATSAGVYSNTIKNAAIIVALLPFAVIYPFCQKYFVTGVTMGAVKE